MLVEAATVSFDSVNVGDQLPTMQKSETQQDIDNYLILNERPEREIEGRIEDVIDDFVARVSCPVFCGLPYGHGKARRVLPIGLDVRIARDVLEFQGVEG